MESIFNYLGGNVVKPAYRNNDIHVDLLTAHVIKSQFSCLYDLSGTIVLPME